LVRRPLLWVALAGATVVLAFVMVLFIAVAADQDARADDGLSGVVCASPGAPGSAVAGFGGRQLVNAGLVVAVGKEMQLPRCCCKGGMRVRWSPLPAARPLP
jgi:hypothetical protein